MKRALPIYAAIMTLAVVLFAWREWRDRANFRQAWIPAPPSGKLQPGLGFFEDIDEVKLVYTRSMHTDTIEVRVWRHPFRPDEPPKLSGTVLRWKEGARPEVLHSVEKGISIELFNELRAFVTRQDLIEKSVTERTRGSVADGSHWILEGTKGDFVIRHERSSPGDPLFLSIGKRLLDLGEIEIPDREFY